MADVMRPVPYRELLVRALGEYRRKGSIFDIPEEHFFSPASGARARIFSASAANPVGPAAGPHTQLAQNILAAWLAGARYIELKTVQKLDTLKVEKPCIDAEDEGYNVEWSTELTLDQAYDEYLKAWFLLHVFETLMAPGNGWSSPRPGSPAGPEAAASFLFNMSVGYDLEGIRTEKMDRFINRLIDSSGEELFSRYRAETASLASEPALLEGTPWRQRAPLLAGLAVSPRLCGSVTLSTMHGCPPREIEAICEHLLREKRLDTLVKLNPTLLGYERVSGILGALGFDSVRLDPEGFSRDLQMADAVPLLGRLLAFGRAQGLHFGVKLSNTLAAANTRGVLPGSEMYMSGRALYPLTIDLAARLAGEFTGALPMSFSGGISAWNAAEVLEAGVRPVTLATELLKPGGYGRLKELACIAEKCSGAWGMSAVDSGKLARAAASALRDERYRKESRGPGRARVAGPLPLLDCFVAPCVNACPIGQDVPEYVHLTGAGRFEEAFGIVWEKNPLPFITGWLCDHQCMGACTRLDWEGAVRIREVKRIAADRGYAAFRAAGGLAARKTAPRKVRVAVLGAGPAGLAAAAFLGREGFEVHVFEREAEPGGVVRHALPGFRLPAEAVERDVSLLRDLGVQLHFRADGSATVNELKGRGFRYVVVSIGAEVDRDAGVPGALPALSFLRQFRREAAGLALGGSVAVVGAGDTAMDAARAARRVPGVQEVTIVYRRSEGEMPASREEFLSTRKDGVGFRFLRQPEAWRPGELTLRIMRLGDPDGSGRPRPLPTAVVESMPADTVISAVGAEADVAALAAIGLGDPVVADPATQETSVDGVYLVGDAASGASTIVEAIASSRRAADAITAREGGVRFAARPTPADWLHEPRRLRDRLIPASGPDASDDETGQVEARRCLACSVMCLKCVEVCPNRANTAIRAGGRDAVQILHLDALCNECGNCATFCPWEGKPYRDKMTVFSREDDMSRSENPGFFLRGGRGLLRLGTRVTPLGVENGSVSAEAPEGVKALVAAVARDHAYLLGPV